MERRAAGLRATPIPGRDLASRERAEQAVARTILLLGRWLEVKYPEKRDLERARRELDEAIAISDS